MIKENEFLYILEELKQKGFDFSMLQETI